MSDYDSYLARCAEEYGNPVCDELVLRGTSLFDVEATRNGHTKIFTSVPMDYWKRFSVADDCEEHPTYYPRWDEISDKIESDYFNFGELEHFELLDAEEDNEKQMPEGYTVTKIFGFSRGHSFDDLYVEE